MEIQGAFHGFRRERSEEPLIWIKQTWLVLVCAALFASLSGCTYFSKQAQDQAACDKISEIMIATGQSGDYGSSFGGKTWGNSGGIDSAEGYVSFADRLEREALPLSSMSFAPTIQRWIKSLRKLDSKSIFDLQAGFINSVDGLADVNARCVAVAQEQ